MNKPVSVDKNVQCRTPSKITRKLSRAKYPGGAIPATEHVLEVASLIPEDPDAVPGTPGVVLPVTEQDKTLATELPIWSNALAGQIVALSWNGERLLEDNQEDVTWHEVLASEAANPNFKFNLSVPVSYLTDIAPGTEQTVRLGYAVQQVGSDDWSNGPDRPVRIDKRAPGGSDGTLARLTFAEAIESRGYILLSDFVSGVLDCQVRGYVNQRQFDAIAVTITDGTDSSGPHPAKVISSGDATLVQLPLSAFDDLKDEVTITFTYVVTDRAGNESVVSNANNALKLLLKDVPGALDKAKVPKFGDEHTTPALLLDKHARAGVKVVIPEIKGLRRNDKIVALYNRLPSDEHTVPFPPPAGDLLEVTLLYTLTSRGPQNGPVDIDYQLWRAGVVIAETTVANVVNVDLRLPGGPDPDPDLPGHGNLKPAVIRGNASGQDDDLTVEDVQQGAKLTISWTDKGNTGLLEEGDALQLVWGDAVDGDNNFVNVFALDAVTKAEADAAMDITREVAPAWLETQPSGRVPMTVTITRAFNPDPDAENNPVFAPFKLVKVIRAKDLPGGGDDLDDLEFTRLNSKGSIDRTAAKNGVPIRIQLFDGAKETDSIQIHLSADDGMVDVPGAPIPEATKDLTSRTLSADEVRNGYITATIEEEWAYKVCLGTATVEYTATNLVGGKRSGHKRTFVAIRNPSDDSCPFPPVRSGSRKGR